MYRLFTLNIKKIPKKSELPLDFPGVPLLTLEMLGKIFNMQWRSLRVFLKSGNFFSSAKP